MGAKPRHEVPMLDQWPLGPTSSAGRKRQHERRLFIGGEDDARIIGFPSLRAVQARQERHVRLDQHKTCAEMRRHIALLSRSPAHIHRQYQDTGPCHGKQRHHVLRRVAQADAYWLPSWQRKTLQPSRHATHSARELRVRQDLVALNQRRVTRPRSGVDVERVGEVHALPLSL